MGGCLGGMMSRVAYSMGMGIAPRGYAEAPVAKRTKLFPKQWEKLKASELELVRIRSAYRVEFNTAFGKFSEECRKADLPKILHADTIRELLELATGEKVNFK